MTRSRLDALICEQEHLETLTRKEIETVQLFKLNRLLLREKKRAGFYRNLPEHLNQLSELASLPFTTEADLSRNAPSLLLTSQRDISLRGYRSAFSIRMVIWRTRYSSTWPGWVN